MALLCASCSRVLPGGESACPSCGGVQIYCGDCRQWLSPGEASCANCSRAELVPVRPVGGDVSSLPMVPVALPVVPPVVERYSAGRFGVDAQVTMPAGDVAALNELAALVTVLHQVASHVGQLRIPSDHTRKLMRDMRVLAADAQEEIEMRRGSGG